MARVVVHFVILVAMLAAVPSAVCTAGPWKVQVVDAETKQPLEGVVIVAVWVAKNPHDAWSADWQEVVTARDGRAVIDARALPRWAEGRPYLEMFRSAYKTTWRLQGSDRWAPHEFWKHDDEWKKITQKGVVLESLPAKTREERLKSLPDRPWGVPLSAMPRFMQTVNRERVELGLAPYKLPASGDRE